jgi:hypothetical protein
MSNAYIRALEAEMNRQALFSLIVLIVVFAITMWVLYLVMRAAIRDGIRESGLVQTWRTTAAAIPQREASDTLPDMYADR